MPSENNKRIAKNTLFLYLRMFLTIVVNLYAVRVIWQVLGVENYGIYNVVGGIVSMFSFLNNAMVASSQRFISFELGTGDCERLRKVFCISVTVHTILAIIVLILAETIGLWFLNEKLNIPHERIGAANWVYQCSIIAFMVNIISVPYNACIVAHEHMKAYGYLGVLDVILRLLIVFLLMFIPFDKLIVYAILILCVSALMRFIYGIYCRKNFAECRYRFISDHSLTQDMFSFAGWSFIGNIGFSARDQGLNFIINLFFNVSVNAAKGIANQIGVAVGGFAQNFQMALNPQITKRYAGGQTDSMMSLVISGCKYSALLILFIVVPFFCASDQILHLWLGNVAPYTIGFIRLILIMMFFDSMVGPITTALQATGHIKWFQIIISVIMILNLPMAWIWLQFYANPYIVMFVSIATSIIALGARIILLHEQIQFQYSIFIYNVFLRILPVLIISGLLSSWLYDYFPKTLVYLVIFCIISIAITSLSSFSLALKHNERQQITIIIINRIKTLLSIG